jgi:hypothetical protein
MLTASDPPSAPEPDADPRVAWPREHPHPRQPDPRDGLRPRHPDAHGAYWPNRPAISATVEDRRIHADRAVGHRRRQRAGRADHPVQARADIRSHWIPVPLDLTSAEAITVLAGTITMTPGTVSATRCRRWQRDPRALPAHRRSRQRPRRHQVPLRTPPAGDLPMIEYALSSRPAATAWRFSWTSGASPWGRTRPTESSRSTRW